MVVTKLRSGECAACSYRVMEARERMKRSSYASSNASFLSELALLTEYTVSHPKTDHKAKPFLKIIVGDRNSTIKGL